MVELIKKYDKMGDLCHSLQAHHTAISYYKQEVDDIYCYNMYCYVFVSGWPCLVKAC